MQSIKINHFKAFKDSIEVHFNDESLLIYGDNGMGKSSIYDALKVIFYWQRLESELPTSTPEEFEELKKNLWGTYDNKKQDLRFSLHIDGQDMRNFDRANHNTFFISLPELHVGDGLNLVELLTRFFLDIPDVTAFCQLGYSLIEEAVNTALLSFHEDVRIEIDKTDFDIMIIDTSRNLKRKANIRRYFNEGKINLVMLLVLFNSIYLNKVPNKKNIIVLDDFITSLDTANRTYIIRCLLDMFADFTIVLFTHSASFFNLIKYMINNIQLDKKDIWTFASLYEIKQVHKIYIKDVIDTVTAIQTDYDAVDNHNHQSIDQFGNRIRKKFETLLYDLSRILIVGGLEESKTILSRISAGKSYYAKAGGKTVYNLMDEIEGLLKNAPKEFLKKRLSSKIDSYKEYNLNSLQLILNDLKLYQKVTMHPMSHGISGLASFTAKEIEHSLEVLSKMEEIVNNLIDGNLTST